MKLQKMASFLALRHVSNRKLLQAGAIRRNSTDEIVMPFAVRGHNASGTDFLTEYVDQLYRDLSPGPATNPLPEGGV